MPILPLPRSESLEILLGSTSAMNLLILLSPQFKFVSISIFNVGFRLFKIWIKSLCKNGSPPLKVIGTSGLDSILFNAASQSSPEISWNFNLLKSLLLSMELRQKLQLRLQRIVKNAEIYLYSSGIFIELILIDLLKRV